MPKEILLYSPIFSFTADAFINQLNEADGEDVVVRINTPGGSVFAGWGMVAKIKEYGGSLKIKVDGAADSMGSIMLLFHNDVEALDVSTFMLHRASTFATDTDSLSRLDKINSDIRAAMEQKLDIVEFERIAGITLDDFFGGDVPVNVTITAKQAKKIGLIKKINKLEAADFEALNAKFAAMNKGGSKDKKQSNQNKMTIEELRTKHPEVYAQAVKVGVAEEKDRAGAWLAYVDVDPKAVSEGIKGGENLSQTAMAELGRKALTAQAVEEAEGETEGEAETEGDDAGGDGASAISDFEKELDGLTKKQ